MTATAIADWLTRQDSYTYRPRAGTVEVVEDPQVPDTFAVRFTNDADAARSVDLMFICGNEEGTDDEVLDRCLEEVEFTAWPPVSGALRFFA